MSYTLTTEDKFVLLLFLTVSVNNPSLNTIKILKVVAFDYENIIFNIQSTTKLTLTLLVF